MQLRAAGDGGENFRAFGLGVALLVAAMFLYEDEEKRLQSRLENAWKRFESVASGSRLRVASITRATATWATDSIDGLVGTEAFSQGFIAVSIALSFLSMCCFNVAELRETQVVEPVAEVASRSTSRRPNGLASHSST